MYTGMYYVYISLVKFKIKKILSHKLKFYRAFGKQ